MNKVYVVYLEQDEYMELIASYSSQLKAQEVANKLCQICVEFTKAYTNNYEKMNPFSYISLHNVYEKSIESLSDDDKKLLSELDFKPLLYSKVYCREINHFEE
jgi:hypothetical protein